MIICIFFVGEIGILIEQTCFYPNQPNSSEVKHSEKELPRKNLVDWDIWQIHNQ